MQVAVQAPHNCNVHRPDATYKKEFWYLSKFRTEGVPNRIKTRRPVKDLLLDKPGVDLWGKELASISQGKPTVSRRRESIHVVAPILPLFEHQATAYK